MTLASDVGWCERHGCSSEENWFKALLCKTGFGTLKKDPSSVAKLFCNSSKGELVTTAVFVFKTSFIVCHC